MKIEDIFKWASAAFALIPGLIVMSTNLGTPPGIAKELYGGIIEAAGAFTLLLLTLNKNSIRQMPVQKINKVSITMIILFVIFLLTYITFFNTQVIYNDKYDTKFFFPLWYGADLEYMVSKAGSKYNSIAAYGPQAVNDGIKNSQTYLEFTRIIFTVLYIATFESIVIAFGLLGLRSSTE